MVERSPAALKNNEKIAPDGGIFLTLGVRARIRMLRGGIAGGMHSSPEQQREEEKIDGKESEETREEGPEKSTDDGKVVSLHTTL